MEAGQEQAGRNGAKVVKLRENVHKKAHSLGSL